MLVIPTETGAWVCVAMHCPQNDCTWPEANEMKKLVVTENSPCLLTLLQESMCTPGGTILMPLSLGPLIYFCIAQDSEKIVGNIRARTAASHSLEQNVVYFFSSTSKGVNC